MYHLGMSHISSNFFLSDLSKALRNGFHSFFPPLQVQFERKVLSCPFSLKPPPLLLPLSQSSGVKITAKKYHKLLLDPIVQKGYDMTRGFYDRAPRDAAVTKLIARSMLSAFFQELSHFEQPLSGGVCVRMQVWQDLINKEGAKPPDG